MSLELDMREFNTALAQYVTVTKRTLEHAINMTALFLIREAKKLAPIASRSKIETQFGAVTTQRISKKTGKVRNVVRYAGPLPVGLAIWRFRKRHPGEALPSNAELQKRARQLRGRALSAIGTLRAGWNRALRTLDAATGSFDNLAGPRVKHPSIASVAKPGWNPLAEIVYQATIRQGGNLTIEPRVEAGLAQAYVHQTASMQNYIAKRLQEDANKFNAN